MTTRGLEPVSAAEVGSLPGVTVEGIGYRRVAAACEALPPLLGLRTVDDVFLDVATWTDVGRPRGALAALREESQALDLADALAACSQVREVPARPRFSVTASFVGRRNYTTEEIKQACAEGIGAGQGWEYVPGDDEADLNVRLFIEHGTAFVGVRVGARPLHRRPYKREHVPGSLKPPVAAALLALAGVERGMRVLDPCCGAGTILVEAALGGAVVEGGDSDPAAVAATRANVAAAGVQVPVRAWDARSLPVARGVVDRVVSNLPWGREVAVEGAAGLYRRVCAEVGRVLAPGGRAVFLVGEPGLVGCGGLRCDEQIEISLYGQKPTIMLFSEQMSADEQL